MIYQLSDKLRDHLTDELESAPSKQIFHAQLQRAVYPEIKGTTILHKNNKLEIYHYD